MVDNRFTNVRPRHPHGGPDGGHDIDATFHGEQKAVGAIGFVNQANDSQEHKKKAKKKFADDLKSAVGAEPDIKAFVFFTNVNLTASEKDALVLAASQKGSLTARLWTGADAARARWGGRAEHPVSSAWHLHVRG